jgi:hypothetical protein
MSGLDGSGAVHTVLPWVAFGGHVPPGGSIKSILKRILALEPGGRGAGPRRTASPLGLFFLHCRGLSPAQSPHCAPHMLHRPRSAGVVPRPCDSGWGPARPAPPGSTPFPVIAHARELRSRPETPPLCSRLLSPARRKCSDSKNAWIQYATSTPPTSQAKPPLLGRTRPRLASTDSSCSVPPACAGALLPRASQSLSALGLSLLSAALLLKHLHSRALALLCPNPP